MAIPQSEIEFLGAGYCRLGSAASAGESRHNTYLFAEGNQAVLFDPCLSLAKERLVADIVSAVPLEKITYIVFQRGQPDMAAGIARLKAAGMRFTIVAHSRVRRRLRDIRNLSPFYAVNKRGFKLKLASGRRLAFISMPETRRDGCFATYDAKARVFLAGGLSKTPGGGVDAAAIFPLWGSVIRIDGAQGKNYSVAAKDAGKEEGPAVGQPGIKEYADASLALLKRFSDMYGAQATEPIAAKLGLDVNAFAGAEDASAPQGLELWNRLGEMIYLAQGLSALAGLEGFVKGLGDEFGVSLPEVYVAVLFEAQRKNEEIIAEMDELKQSNAQYMESIHQTNEAQARDTVTGLYHEAFYRDFIDEQASLLLSQEGVEDDVLAMIGIDEGMARIEYQYGPREVEAILKGVSRILLEHKDGRHIAFCLHGTTFAFWMPRVKFHEAMSVCEDIRRSVEISKAFIEPVTVSVGLVALAEVSASLEDPAEAGETLSYIGIKRLRVARKRGGNTICFSSEIGKEADTKARILIVDDDITNVGVIRTFLENADYTVAEAADGAEALKKIAEEGYDLIISELMLPKIDGFMLKETLSQKTGTKDIPFILLSHLKDEQTIGRAYGIGVNHYLQKPYLLAELLGIVKNMVSSGHSR